LTDYVQLLEINVPKNREIGFLIAKCNFFRTHLPILLTNIRRMVILNNMAKVNHRSKILDAGLEVFYEHGFHGSGVQDVVDQAGVPKGSFYNHFKSKEALGLEVLETYWSTGNDARAELRASSRAPLKRIDRHLAALGYDKNGCLIGNFSAELAGVEQFRSRLVELFQSWKSEVAACIKDGQNDGTIRGDAKAENLAEFVVEGMQGAQLKAKIEQDPAVVARYRKSIQLFLKSH